jgi:hypothetical protein
MRGCEGDEGVLRWGWVVGGFWVFALFVIIGLGTLLCLQSTISYHTFSIPTPWTLSGSCQR